MIAKTRPSSSAARRTCRPTSSRSRVMEENVPGGWERLSTWPAKRCRKAPETPCCAIQWKCRRTVVGLREEKRVAFCVWVVEEEEEEEEEEEGKESPGAA